MPVDNYLSAHSGRRGPARRKNGGRGRYRPLPIWRWIGLYLMLLIGALGLKFALFTIAVGWSLLLSLIVHLICGYVLNTTVLSKIGFHHVYSTLQNVATTKFIALLFWQLVYPVLLVQLLIARYL